MSSTKKALKYLGYIVGRHRVVFFEATSCSLALNVSAQVLVLVVMRRIKRINHGRHKAVLALLLALAQL